MHETTIHSVPLLAMLPFILMLLSIAVFPVVWNHFWEKNLNKLIIAVVLSVPVLIFLIANDFNHELIHSLVFDYIPFIVLLGSLFTITGGIYLSGDIEAKPIVNTGFMAIGAVLASLMGTTGAAMLLIRALIQTNKERQYKVHTILFFIAIVANCGGLLTPLGDPPLFMMYLRGAPFFWFTHLYVEWATANAFLLVVYFLVDSYFHKKEPAKALKADREQKKPLRLQGNINFIFLLGVVLGVAFINKNYFPFLGVPGNEYFGFMREGVLVLMGVLSLYFTKAAVRKANNFTWHPIEEVAYLFLGIFITMVPCLIYLQANASSLGVQTPIQFYYYTGLLSSFLDNTPTAVTFWQLAQGLHIFEEVAHIPERLLIAISTAAVFFGAMTYIGNGPNFMVKAVAEENKIKMPDFFAYIYKFSLPVLLPIFIVVQLFFISNDGFVEGVQLVNKTGTEITHIYISNAGADEWRTDVDGLEFIAKGTTATVRFSGVDQAHCNFDIAITDDAGNIFVRRDINLCKNKTVALTPDMKADIELPNNGDNQ